MAATEVKRSRSEVDGGSDGAAPASGKKSRTEQEAVALFLFRRDLRVVDNTGLQALCDEAARRSLGVLPVFFFNPAQCDKKQNPYFGDNFFQFFCESLADLDGAAQLNNHLVCLRGSDAECLGQIRESGYDVTLLGYNEDFTPFALARDQLLGQHAEQHGITCVVGKQDYTLRPLDAVVNGSDKPYSVFTPFSNAFLAQHASQVPAPLKTDVTRVQSLLVAKPKKYLEAYAVDPAKMYAARPSVREKGGRAEGLKRLEYAKSLKNYGDVRNDIAHDQTTHLSPHLKCGTVSMREVWHTTAGSLGHHHALPRQLIWREFYAMLALNHPRLLQGQLRGFADNKDIVPSGKESALVNAPFQEKYDNFTWKWKSAHFDAFRAGQTGVPLVDAAVRCVTETGWCHNRCRMTISNFAVKVLSIDWRECERWFATVAVDYDVANNNGGWLWSSGQGADAQPFFRTFNPFRQSQRFDPDCEFIFQWVPELKKVPPSVVHKWDEYCAKRYQQIGTKKGSGKKKGEAEAYDTTYPAPIVDIKEAKTAVMDAFREHAAKNKT